MHFKSGDSISVLKAGIQMWISKCSVLHAWHHHPSLSTPNCSMTLMISFVTVCHRMPLPQVLVIQWFYICPFIFLFLYMLNYGFSFQDITQFSFAEKFLTIWTNISYIILYISTTLDINIGCKIVCGKG